MYPIIVICHNNHIYVDNTIKQISKINNKYTEFISILNNNSDDPDTIEYLKYVSVNVIHNKENLGPSISRYSNVELYNSLPNKYIITDPDLKLNDNIPSNFIEILDNISDKYNVNRIGFALDISDSDKFFTNTYYDGKTIYEWESRFWTNKINDNTYELYYAPIDTTFCLINKLVDCDSSIRIAGNFTAKHLPWYKTNELLNIHQQYQMYKCSNGVSTISSIVLADIFREYLSISKNDQIIFIKDRREDANISFWTQHFTNWEATTFNVFDKLLTKDKVCIDIGGWIGTTCIYASRLSKHVYVVEADRLSYNDLLENCRINTKNITCINKAVYKHSNQSICIGKNKYLSNSKLNDSTTQIYEDGITDDSCYTVDTTTVQDIISKYSIDPYTISLIKVDIEGSEEYILDELYTLHTLYNIPLYIRFHHTWWKNTDLNRFILLTEDHKKQISIDPFCSILFS